MSYPQVSSHEKGGEEGGIGEKRADFSFAFDGIANRLIVLLQGRSWIY